MTLQFRFLRIWTLGLTSLGLTAVALAQQAPPPPAPAPAPVANAPGSPAADAPGSPAAPPAVAPGDLPPSEVIKERFPNGAVAIDRHVIKDPKGAYVNHGKWTAYYPDGKTIGGGE